MAHLMCKVKIRWLHMASAYSIFFYCFHHKMLDFNFELHSEGLEHLLNGVDTSTLQTCSPEHWELAWHSQLGLSVLSGRNNFSEHHTRPFWECNGLRQEQDHSTVMSESRQYMNAIRATKY